MNAGEVAPGDRLDLDRQLAERPELAPFERRGDVEAALRSFFGANYRAHMKASPLPSRMRRMQSEIDRGQESLERKLRYLFWIN